MCSRFYYSKEGILRVMSELELEEGFEPFWPEGIVAPGGSSLIVTASEGGLALKEGSFGFPGKDGSLVINARVETALAKPMFSSSMLYRRCVIPAEGFFEWDAAKNKVEFKDPASSIIYLAGFWQLYEKLLRFVILTTAANASMSPVHDRMPLMLPRDAVRPWILEGSSFQQLLSLEMPTLLAHREQEQLSLF